MLNKIKNKNILGKLVAQTPPSVIITTSTQSATPTKINISTLPSGVYFVRVLYPMSNGSDIVGKFVKE